MPNNISNIQFEEICHFTSFNQWANKAQSWIGGFRAMSETVICLDRNGNLCFIGEDFRLCTEHDRYPVTAYRLIRTKEAVNNQ